MVKLKKLQPLQLLVAVNILTIVVALFRHWDLGDVLWTYLGQNIAVGLVNCYRILQLPGIDPKLGIYRDDKPITNDPIKSKIYTALFFLFHYGSFNFGYGLWLFTKFPEAPFLSLGFYLVFLAYMINHFYSYRWHKQLSGEQSINLLMGMPYLRVMVMYFFIIFVGSVIDSLPQLGLVIFMITKTGGDVLAHKWEHKLRRD